MGICSASKNIWGSGPRYPNNCAKTGITGEIWQSTCSAPCALRVVRSMCLAIQHNHIVSAWIFGDFMGQGDPLCGDGLGTRTCVQSNLLIILDVRVSTSMWNVGIVIG